MPDSDPDDEGLCADCWRRCAGPILRRYEAAWHDADAADRAGIVDMDAFSRVTAAWTELEAHALKVCTPVFAGRA